MNAKYREQTLPRIVGTGFLLLLFCLAARPARAQVGITGITGKAGTLGLGAELTVGLGRQVNGRIGVNAFNYSERGEASRIEYKADAELRSATALLDWQPGGGAFRLTGGLVWNGTQVSGRSIPSSSGTYDIG